MGDTSDRKVKTDKTKRTAQTISTSPCSTILNPVPRKLVWDKLLHKKTPRFQQDIKKNT